MAFDVGKAVAYLDMDITAFNSAIESANSSLKRLGGDTPALFKTLDSVVGKINDIGIVATNVGNQLTSSLTVPITDFGKSSFDTFVSFESAFTGVRKTVDATEQEFEELYESIERMAASTSSTFEEIAGAMEVAGQLGVPTEALESFTQTMIQLGDSTNLTAEQAATNLARVMNITGTSFEEVGRLGAAIVDLGNNFATQEDEIVLMTNRLASAGTMAGLTTPQILALSTAMTSVGIRAEAGGTAMSTTLSQITKMMAEVSSTNEETAAIAVENLELISSIAGMTSQEFAAYWKGEPIVALTAFIEGLGKMENGTEGVVMSLDQLGMSGIRQSNMLRSLSLASEQMGRALETSNNAWNESTALIDEANKRYATTESRMNQLNERFRQVKAEIGERLLPVFERFVTYAETLLDMWDRLDDGMKENIIHWGMIVAAIGPALVIFGKVVSGVGLMLQVFTSLGVGISGIIGKFVSLGTSLGSVFVSIGSGINNLVGWFGKLVSGIGGVFTHGVKLADVLTKLGAVFKSTTFLTSALVAGIALLVAGFIKAYQSSETVRNAVSVLFDVAKRGLNVIISILGMLWKALEPIITKLVDFISRLIEILLPPLSRLLSGIMSMVEAFMPILGFILEGLSELVGIILDFLMPALEFLAEAIGVVVDAFAWLFQTIGDGVKKLFGIKEETKKAGEGIVDGLVEGISSGKDKAVFAVTDLGNTAVSKFNSTLGSDGIKSTVFENIGKISSFSYSSGIESGKQQVVDTITSLGQQAVSVFQLHTIQVNDVAKQGMFDLEQSAINSGNNLYNIQQESNTKMQQSQQVFLDERLSSEKGFQDELVIETLEMNDKIEQDTEKTYDGVSEIVGDSYGEMKDSAGDYSDETDKVTDNVSDNLDTMENDIGVSAEELWNPLVHQTTGTLHSIQVAFQTVCNNLVQIVNNTTNPMSEAAGNLFQPLIDASGEPLDVVLERVRQVMLEITMMVSNVIATMNVGYENIKNSARNIEHELESFSATINYTNRVVNGSHSAGLDYVPFDGYIARLHQGERVLTKQENREYNDGNSGSSGDTYNFYNTKPDPYEYARQMKRVKRELKKS